MIFKKIQFVHIKFQNKWSAIMNDDIPIHITEKAFTKMSKMLEGSYVRYIQFRLFHNRTVTNHK